MEMNELRAEIDGIDRELVELFRRRMEVSKKIGTYKKERGLPVRDAAREREKLDRVRKQAGEELAPYAEALFGELFRLSRDLQEAEI